MEDLNNSIAILEADPEVRGLLAQKLFGGFRDILTSGERLSADPETDTSKINENNIAREKEVGALRTELTQSYVEEIVNGGILKDGLAAGKGIETVLQEYNRALSFYMTALPEEVINANADKLEATYRDFYESEIMLEGGGGVTEKFHQEHN